MNETSLFIFRRDLRLSDNTALNAACKESKHVILVFILTPAQFKNNKFKSKHLIEFMLRALAQLRAKCKARLNIIYGSEIIVLGKIYREHKFDAIYFNADYTPYSKIRDNKIKKFCEGKKISCKIYNDILLAKNLIVGDAAKGRVTKGYLVFSHFLRAAKKEKVPKPQTHKRVDWKNFVNLNAMLDNHI